MLNYFTGKLLLFYFFLQAAELINETHGSRKHKVETIHSFKQLPVHTQLIVLTYCSILERIVVYLCANILRWIYSTLLLLGLEQETSSSVSHTDV